MDYELKSIDKIKTDKYQIRYEGGFWADIFLEDWDLGNSGKVLINSDWGTWEASWGAMGDDIRDFLLRINKDYTMKNLARGTPDFDTFNKEATLKEIKEGIIATRLSEDKSIQEYGYCWSACDKEEARQAWDSAVEFFDEISFQTAEGYCSAVLGSGCKWLELWPETGYFPCVTGYHPRFLNFMNNIWPDFLDIIRKEKALKCPKS